MNEEKGIELTSGGYKILGNLINLKDLKISDAIKQRGGGQNQVSQLSTEYRQVKVGELANLAAKGNREAKTAIKILKQARKKKEKYGGK